MSASTSVIKEKTAAGEIAFGLLQVGPVGGRSELKTLGRARYCGVTAKRLRMRARSRAPLEAKLLVSHGCAISIFFVPTLVFRRSCSKRCPLHVEPSRRLHQEVEVWREGTKFLPRSCCFPTRSSNVNLELRSEFAQGLVSRLMVRLTDYVLHFERSTPYMAS